MKEDFLNYLTKQKGQTLGALSGNSNGVLEISIGLKQESAPGDETDAGHMIRNAKLLIMTNRWVFSSPRFLPLDNRSSVRETERAFVELEPTKITMFEVSTALDEFRIATDSFGLKIVRNAGFEMLVHDFDHQGTLVLNDEGEITITSKNKEFQF